MADIPDDFATTAVFEGDPAIGASFSDLYETVGDSDRFKVDLVGGTTYSLYGSNETAHQDMYLRMFDPLGGFVDYEGGGIGINTAATYTAPTTGTYYIRVFDRFFDAGQYAVELTAVPATDHFLTGGNDTYSGEAGERILGGAGDDAIDIGKGVDALGEQGNDTLTGNGSDNFISGGTGADHIYGNDGNDNLFGDAGNDIIDGGSGNDRIYGGIGADTMQGGTGDDTYHVDSAKDVVIELAGPDADTVHSTISYVLGANLENLVLDGTANISATGNELANELTGNSAVNILDGGASADTMSGGDGSDTYHVDDAGDVVNELGTTGMDTVISSISFSLSDATHAFGDFERLALTGSADIDGTGNALANVLVGNSGNNVLSGLDGIDNLFGRAGNDHLVGGDGNDALNGGDGADELIGGAGRDRLTGGSGADTFVFTSIAESNLSATGRDVILDFSSAEGDKIDVSAIDADSVTAGAQHFSFIGTAQFTHQAGELRYGVRSGNVYVYGDTDGDGHVDFSVLLNGVASIQAGDFVL